MNYLSCVHIHLGNIWYKYRWNHGIVNKSICIFMNVGGGGGGDHGASRIFFCNEIHLA